MAVFCATEGEIFEKYPKAKHINKLIIFNCFATIKSWLDVELLSGYLMRYGVIRNTEDMELITSPYYKPHDRLISLMKLVERAGRNGFQAFYVSLNESAEYSRGHADAVAEINRHVDQAYAKISLESEDIGDPENSTSRQSPEPSPRLTRTKSKRGDPNIDYRIAYLEDRFCSLSTSLYDELVEKNVKAKDVIKYMISLPYKLKRELADSIRGNMGELKKTEEVMELHAFLDTQLWNFIDYYLLEHLISKCGSVTLRSQMTEYVTELRDFMRNTTVSSLIQFWPGRKDSPLQYTKVSVTLDLNPNECTLEQLNNVRQKLCECFLPPLSEFAVLYYNFREGSVLVILLLSDSLIPTLVKNLCSSSCHELFEEHNIISLCVKGIQLYPLSVNSPLQPENSRSIQSGDTYYTLTKRAQEYFYILSNPSLSTEVASLTITLCDLTNQFSTYLRSKIITIDHIIDAFPMLPPNMKPKYKATIESISHSQVFSKLSSCLDYVRIFSLLKIAINEFGDDQLKKEMELYIKRIQDLRERVPLHHLLDVWKNDPSNKLPVSHTTVDLKLQKDPITFTLSDLEEFRLKFASEFKKCLSGPSSLTFHGISRGSIIVSWGVCRNDAQPLNEELVKDTNREFLEKNAVDQVSLHNKVAFDNSCPPRVLSFIQISSITDIASAKNPCLTINQDGWMIQAYKDTAFRSHLSSYYRIGKIPADGENLEWTETESLYSSGSHSKIQLNDHGTVVAVFQSGYPKTSYYTLGRLDTGHGVIKRLNSPFAFASGGNPSAALNNTGTVLVTFEKGYIRKKSFYGIGNVNEANGIISWQTDFIKFSISCCDVSSALNDHGTVIFSARTYQHSFICLVGRIQPNRSDVTLQVVTDPSTGYGSCCYASIGLNRSGNVVWIKSQEKRVIIITGRVIQSYIKQDSAVDCNLKLNIAKTLERQIHCPSASISNDNTVGFTYFVKDDVLGYNNTSFSIVGEMVTEDTLSLLEKPYATFLPDQLR